MQIVKAGTAESRVMGAHRQFATGGLVARSCPDGEREVKAEDCRARTQPGRARGQERGPVWPGAGGQGYRAGGFSSDAYGSLISYSSGQKRYHCPFHKQ